MDVKRLRVDPTALTELHFSREIQAAPIESAHEAIAAAAQAHKFDSVKQSAVSLHLLL